MLALTDEMIDGMEELGQYYDSTFFCIKLIRMIVIFGNYKKTSIKCMKDKLTQVVRLTRVKSLNFS